MTGTYPNPDIQRLFKRVSRKLRCPICDHDSWCRIDPSGSVHCMRISAGADYAYTQKDGNTAYVHLSTDARAAQDDRRDERIPEPRTDNPPRLTLAPIWRRDRVYRAMLEALPLAGHHANNLERRGLSDVEIARNLYATIPDPRTAARLVKTMAEAHDLAGIPGFYRDNLGWRLNVTDWFAGFFIPVRDISGHIQALKIRRDSNDGGKYVWLTSTGKREGISPGAPLHIAHPWHIASSGELLITEGPLKGDIAAERLCVTTLALPGAGSIFNDFQKFIHYTFPDLQSAYVGIDADWRVNNHVRAGFLRLINELVSEGISTTVLTWPGAKGIDDFLTAREVEI